MNAAIVALQTAINRYSADPLNGFSAIAADGVFGKGSLAALLLALWAVRVQSEKVGEADAAIAADLGDITRNLAPETVMQHLAAELAGESMGTSLTGMLSRDADLLNLPARVAPSKAPPSMLPTPSGEASKLMLTQIKAGNSNLSGSILDAFRNLPLWAKVALGAGVVGGVAFVATKKKKPKGQHALTGY